MRTLLMTMLFGLAASCAPNAQPVADPTNRPTPATGGYQAAQPRVEAWVSLGTVVEVAPLQQTITVSGQGGNVANLLVKGVTGETKIAQIRVEYMDKQVKTVALNKTFLPGDGQVIELRDARPIERITVFIDPDTKGTFEILGA